MRLPVDARRSAPRVRWLLGALVLFGSASGLGAAACGTDAPASNDSNPVEAGVDEGGREPPLSVEAACEDHYRAYVERAKSCGLPRELDPKYKLCAELATAPGSNTSAAQWTACAKAVREQPCVEFQYSVALEACAFYGLLPAGGECRFGAQCASGVCYAFDKEEPWQCGQCTALTPAGEECGNVDAQGVLRTCPSGLSCSGRDGGTRTCAPAPRDHLNLLNPGDACEIAPDAARCPIHAPCMTTVPHASKGTCRALPGPGEPCASYLVVSEGICAFGARCAASTEFLLGVCEAIENPGELDSYCRSDDGCNEGLYCSAWRCAPRRADGEPCLSVSECSKESLCRQDSPSRLGRCERALAPGADCAQPVGDGGAVTLLRCLDGRCERETTEADGGVPGYVCVGNVRGPGETCSEFVPCVSPAWCGDAGTCAITLCGGRPK